MYTIHRSAHHTDTDTELRSAHQLPYPLERSAHAWVLLSRLLWQVLAPYVGNMGVAVAGMAAVMVASFHDTCWSAV